MFYDEREKTGWWVEVGRCLSKEGHSLNSGKSEFGICEVFVMMKERKVKSREEVYHEDRHASLNFRKE